MTFPANSMVFHAISVIIGGMDQRKTLPEPIRVSVTVLSQMFLYLAAIKVDIDSFLRSFGVNPADVKSPDARIPIETYLLIQEEAAGYTNDPYFGLHMGEFAEAGSWSILGYLMMNSKNLGEAFEKASKYSRIIGNLIEAQAELRNNQIEIVYSTPPHAPKMSRHCFESTFSSSVRMMRALTGVNLSPLEVRFIYPQPASTAEYERIFCCPVYFEQEKNSLTIDISMLYTPILLPNPELLQYFENYAQEFLAKMDRQNEYTRRVTKLILSHLDDETLSIDSIAREMAISVRTLQNRLEEEGVVFSELLQLIREKLAKKYLRENYSVETITYLLGFSEPSVFRKAFKKWSGVTPREYREQAYSAMPRV
jgi:AraC-like DNA-binding protein